MSRSSSTHSAYSHHIDHEVRNQAVNVNKLIGFLDAFDIAMVSLGMVVVVQNRRGLLAGHYKRQAVTNTLRLSRVWLHLPYDHLAKITARRSSSPEELPPPPCSPLCGAAYHITAEISTIIGALPLQ